MKVNNEKLNKIYDKTCGLCHICHKKITLSNYGKYRTEGAWHIDHSIPRSKGGTDHLNNLYPACIPCNLTKSDSSNRWIRSTHGQSRAPYSRSRLDKISQTNTAKGAVAGASIGSFLGPGGALMGCLLGGIIGKSVSPEK